MPPPPIALREQLREDRFKPIWSDLNKVFADVAPYYDRANNVASLGLWGHFLRQFMSTVDVRPNDRVLDVCAGTNAIGIALLQREPTLRVDAIDRSADMQRVGTERAEARGLTITSTIGDVHHLPFPDNSFDVVTLQFASRHLKVRQVFEQIFRVLRPGGHFHHSDMLRPANPVVEKLYYTYLRGCLAFTGFVFRSDEAALNCKRYFINALEMFYSAQELSDVLREHGFTDVTHKSVFQGMLAFHRAVKPVQVKRL